MANIVRERLRSALFVLIIGSALGSGASPQQKPTSPAVDRAWDTLVKEKGGRDKLYAVNNLLIERRSGNWVRLCVLPDYEWEYFGPFFDTRWTTVSDRKKALLVKATQNGEIEERRDEQWDSNLQAELIFLLETKWDRPTLLKVNRVKEGKLSFDVIETQVGRYKLGFGYEPEEMLVRRVFLYVNDVLFRIYSFDGFSEVGGIKMPTQMAELTAGEYAQGVKFQYEQLAVRLNVAYDPHIFDRPLKSTAGDAWKRRPGK